MTGGAVYGEAVTLYDEADGWAWIQLARDGYVGYVPANAVRPGPLLAPTHRVQTLGTFVYAAPDIKTPPLMHLPLNALVTVTGGGERFFLTRLGRERIKFGNIMRQPVAIPLGIIER